MVYYCRMWEGYIALHVCMCMCMQKCICAHLRRPHEAALKLLDIPVAAR